MMYEDTITGFPSHRGAIDLPRTERKREQYPDLRAAHGIILGVLISGNFLLWAYIAARAIFGG